jgi:GNAT superfamily N-acetyltransferase
MFRAMGVLPAGDRREKPMARATAAFARKALRSGELVAWVAEVRGVPVGSGGALLRSLLPSPKEPRPRIEAYVLNMYTEPEARGRGVASAILRAILAHCRRRRAARAVLHASDAGRPVYERLGFEDPGSVLEFRWTTAMPTKPKAGARRALRVLADPSCCDSGTPRR